MQLTLFPETPIAPSPTRTSDRPFTLKSLLPYAGSKAKSQYNWIQPAKGLTTTCEPFFGAAGKSLQQMAKNPATRIIGGESNPSMRAIALCLNSPDDFISGYSDARSFLWNGLPVDAVLDWAREMSRSDAERLQPLFRNQFQSIADELDSRWTELTRYIFDEAIAHPDSIYASGYYSFAARSCMGNVMRTNPKGTSFNAKWYVSKIVAAHRFDEAQFIEHLRSLNWDPVVFEAWEEAIEFANPADTWIFLDPPYLAGKGQKMTPCYPTHRITTDDGRKFTLGLAIASLESVCSKRFRQIFTCNYLFDELDQLVQDIASNYGYHLRSHNMGKLGAMGNSAGRLKHGERVDDRENPDEVIYELVLDPDDFCQRQRVYNQESFL